MENLEYTVRICGFREWDHLPKAIELVTKMRLELTQRRKGLLLSVPNNSDDDDDGDDDDDNDSSPYLRTRPSSKHLTIIPTTLEGTKYYHP